VLILPMISTRNGSPGERGAKGTASIPNTGMAPVVAMNMMIRMSHALNQGRLAEHEDLTNFVE